MTEKYTACSVERIFGSTFCVKRERPSGKIIAMTRLTYRGKHKTELNPHYQWGDVVFTTRDLFWVVLEKDVPAGMHRWVNVTETLFRKEDYPLKKYTIQGQFSDDSSIS